MIEMTLTDAAAAMNAAPVARGDCAFKGVSIDSRTLVPGNLFFALAGEHFDGHDFCEAALAAGAAGLVVSRMPAGLPTGDAPILTVADTLTALSALARHWRTRLPGRVVGVTGSNGKTTVKEMILRILSQSHRAFATPGNLNNHIGVPLTLCRIGREDDFAVVEMGTSGPGEIAHLASVGQPDVALVNNCGAAHLEKLKTVAGVAEEKSAIYRGLRPNGIAVINADDRYADVCRAAAGGARQLTFSMEPASGADVRLIEATTLSEGAGSTRMRFVAEGATIDCELALPGRHNVANALAAAACALACGISAADIAAGLSALVPTAGRVQVLRAHGGARIIHDAYNANPDSLRAGLDTLADLAGESWLLLGEMRELGEDAADVHRQVGAEAAARGVTRLFTFGPVAALAGETFPGTHEGFDTHESLAARLETLLTPTVVLLIKGSRANRLERVVDCLIPKEALA